MGHEGVDDVKCSQYGATQYVIESDLVHRLYVVGYEPIGRPTVHHRSLVLDEDQTSAELGEVGANTVRSVAMYIWMVITTAIETVTEQTNVR